MNFHKRPNRPMKDFWMAGIIAAVVGFIVMAFMGILGAFFGGIAGFFFGWIFDDSGVVLREWLQVPESATWYEVGAISTTLKRTRSLWTPSVLNVSRTMIHTR
jgi:ABC-type dipeptide/oligopeptide/nickel transport system permease subunit